MQNKKVTQSILISVSVDDLLEAGIDMTKIIETCVCGGQIIIRNAETNNYICDGDCENCPCYELCDNSEAN